jgi:hypothetical protein
MNAAVREGFLPRKPASPSAAFIPSCHQFYLWEASREMRPHIDYQEKGALIMKSLLTKRKRDVAYRLLILMVVVCVLVAVPLLSSAHSSSASITVSNNSSREIRFLYLSSVDQDNWGPDQLNNATLNNGQSATLTNVSCSGAQIKVIAEDSDGCFLYGVVSCDDNVQWTITNETPADCGSE